MSPTDSLVSPCTQAIWRLRSQEDREVVKEEVDELPRHDVKKFVHPKIVPTSLPLVLSSENDQARTVFAALEWDCTCVAPAQLEATAIPESDNPLEYLVQLSEANARALISTLTEEDDQPFVLITSHQICKIGGEIRKIPTSAKQATDWLSSYSDNCATIVTAITVVNSDTGAISSATEEAIIRWRTIPADVIDRIVKKGAIYQRAGAIDILDGDLDIYLEEVERGSVDGVFGMPVRALLRVLSEILVGRESF